MIFNATLLLLLFSAIVAAVLKNEKHIRLFSLIAPIAVAALLGVQNVARLADSREMAEAPHLWHTDAFSSLLILLIVFLYLVVSLVSYRYIGHEFRHGEIDGGRVRLYFSLVPLFVFTMLVAVAADNLGIMWMALEGTTLTTALLVSFYRKEASIEAAWKYMILCSLGIGLGLLGMLLFFSAAVSAGLDPEQALSLQTLRAHAGLLNPSTVQWAFVFVFIGLGTKVGFVPMHAWLPDAHSKTPSPVSALLSGVLLNVAFACIVRLKGVADATLASATWSNQLFLAFGVLSVVAGGFFLLRPSNYKRMLAYSSIEHMGIIAFAFGLGPAGILPGLLHMIGHTLTKSLLFFGAGEILLATGTTKIEGISGLMKKIPVSASLFLLGIVALLAIPPSPLFMSELLIVSTALQSHPLAAATVLLALTLAATGMFSATLKMFYGSAAPAGEHHAAPVSAREPIHISAVVMIAQLAALAVLGFLLVFRVDLSPLFDVANHL